MSVNVADNVECWSLIAFGCDIYYTFDSNLICSIHCFYAAVLALYSIIFHDLLLSPISQYSVCSQLTFNNPLLRRHDQP